MNLWVQCPHATDGHGLEIVALDDPSTPRRCPGCGRWYVAVIRVYATDQNANPVWKEDGS